MLQSKQAFRSIVDDLALVSEIAAMEKLKFKSIANGLPAEQNKARWQALKKKHGVAGEDYREKAKQLIGLLKGEVMEEMSTKAVNSLSSRGTIDIAKYYEKWKAN